MSRFVLFLFGVMLLATSVAFGSHTILRPTDHASVATVDSTAAGADMIYFDLTGLGDSLELDKAELKITYTGLGEDGEPLELLVAAAKVDWRTEVFNLSLEEEPSFHSELAQFATVLCGQNQQAALDVTPMVRSWMESSVTNHGLLLRAVNRPVGEFIVVDGQGIRAELSLFLSAKMPIHQKTNSGDDGKSR